MLLHINDLVEIHGLDFFCHFLLILVCSHFQQCKVVWGLSYLRMGFVVTFSCVIDCTLYISILYFYSLGFFVCFFVFLGFSRQGFFVALEPVLALVLVDQASLELTEIRLPLPPKCWN